MSSSTLVKRPAAADPSAHPVEIIDVDEWVPGHSWSVRPGPSSNTSREEEPRHSNRRRTLEINTRDASEDDEVQLIDQAEMGSSSRLRRARSGELREMILVNEVNE